MKATAAHTTNMKAVGFWMWEPALFAVCDASDDELVLEAVEVALEAIPVFKISKTFVEVFFNSLPVVPVLVPVAEDVEKLVIVRLPLTGPTVATLEADVEVKGAELRVVEVIGAVVNATDVEVGSVADELEVDVTGTETGVDVVEGRAATPPEY